MGNYSWVLSSKIAPLFALWVQHTCHFKFKSSYFVKFLSRCPAVTLRTLTFTLSNFKTSAKQAIDFLNIKKQNYSNWIVVIPCPFDGPGAVRKDLYSCACRLSGCHPVTSFAFIKFQTSNKFCSVVDFSDFFPNAREFGRCGHIYQSGNSFLKL